MTSRRALLGLIAISGLFRLAWAASLGPGNDEAYHYLFTVHRDWSYFDHPPMLALVESVGVALAGGVVSVISLRLGFVLLFAGSTWLMARLTTRFYGERAGLLAAFALNVTPYYSAAAGAFALPDGPLLFFWLLTLDRLAVAIDAPDDGSARPWATVGLAWGCALLSKYHAVFLPAGTLLYLVFEPSARRWLRRPAPYLALAIGLVVFAPVIGWNAAHGWVSFLFQGGRAIGSARFRPETLLAALILPAFYLFPTVWYRLITLLVGGGRRFFDPATPAANRFLLCQAVFPLSTFLAVSCTRPVLPHWTLVGFLPLFPMLGESWNRTLAAEPARFRRRLVVYAFLPIVLAAGAVFQAHTGFLQKGRPGGLGLVSVSQDPTADMVGWDTIAAELRRRGLLNRPGTFLFTSSWYLSGQLAFATRGSATPVLCYHAWDARSFAFWSKPDDWVGHDGILVEIDGTSIDYARFSRWFTRLEPLGAFRVERAGALVRKIQLYRCVNQTMAFPFDDLGRTIHPRRQGRESRVASGAEGGLR